MLSTYFKNKESKNLILFILGKGISVFGSSIYTFAISLYVLKVTGSALNFATTLLLGILPMIIFSPFAGLIVDRFPKKMIIVGTDFLNGMLFFILYLSSMNQPLSIGAIYITTVLLSIFSTLFALSMESSKPLLVSADKLLKINAVSKMIDSLSAILGPILGGMAFAIFDIRLFIAINALSFVFSAITECFFTFQKRQTKPEVHSSVSQALNEGIQYFRASSELKKLTSVFIFINFFLGFSIQVPMPFIINSVLTLSPKWYGVINSAFPIGMVLGSLVVEKIMAKVDYNKLLMAMVVLMALCALFVGIPLVLPLSRVFIGFIYIGIMFLLGIAIALIDIPIMFILQSSVPEYIRGRIMSLITSLVKIVLPISLIISGALLQTLPSYYLPILGGVFALVYSFIYYVISNKKIINNPTEVSEVN